jgi:phage protein D
MSALTCHRELRSALPRRPDLGYSRASRTWRIRNLSAISREIRVRENLQAAVVGSRIRLPVRWPRPAHIRLVSCQP